MRLLSYISYGWAQRRSRKRCDVHILDVKSGKWHVENEEMDQLRPALISHDKLYIFPGKLFGVKNTLETFQRAMNNTQSPLKWQSALLHLNNIIIFLRSLHDHIKGEEQFSSLFHDARVTPTSRCLPFTQTQLLTLAASSAHDVYRSQHIQRKISKDCSPCKHQQTRLLFRTVEHFPSFRARLAMESDTTQQLAEKLLTKIFRFSGSREAECSAKTFWKTQASTNSCFT